MKNTIDFLYYLDYIVCKGAVTIRQSYIDQITPFIDIPLVKN